MEARAYFRAETPNGGERAFALHRSWWYRHQVVVD